MSLPKLPESFPAGYIAKTEHFYTADQMREYGQACRNQALEEAATLCLRMKTVSGDDDVERGFNAALRRANTAIKELI